MKIRFLLLCLLLAAGISDAQPQHRKKDKNHALYEKAMADKNYVDALKYINALIDKSPDDEWAFLEKAEVYRQMDRISDAFDNVQLAMNINNKNYECYNEAAMLFESTGDYDKAISYYGHAIGLAPDSLKNIYIINCATAKSKIRRFDEAYADYMSVYKTDSTDIALLNNLSSVLDDLGREEESIRLLKKIITIDSTFVGSYINLGFKYSLMGEYEKSIAYFNKALQIDPAEAITYNNRGYSKYKMNDLKGALADVNKSLEMYPGNSYAYRNRALIYIAQKRTNMACEEIEKALQQGFTLNYGDEMEKLKAEYCR